MLLNVLKSSHADVAFIQETHFKYDKLPILKSRFFPLTYHSTNPLAKSKGVSILVSSKLPWKCQAEMMDSEGHFVFLKGLVGETLAMLYTPNDQKAKFIAQTLDKLMEFAKSQFIL